MGVAPIGLCSFFPVVGRAHCSCYTPADPERNTSGDQRCPRRGSELVKPLSGQTSWGQWAPTPQPAKPFQIPSASQPKAPPRQRTTRPALVLSVCARPLPRWSPKPREQELWGRKGKAFCSGEKSRDHRSSHQQHDKRQTERTNGAGPGARCKQRLPFPGQGRTATAPPPVARRNARSY